MTTDAEATLFESVRAITQRNFGDDSLAGQHERAKLLAAIEEYVQNEHPDERWFATAKAKIAVCDAVVAWEPEANRNSTSWSRVQGAIATLRKLEAKP